MSTMTNATTNKAKATALPFTKLFDSSKPMMKPPLTVPQLYSRALWDPTPTTTVTQQKQLAYALGYPMDWRVERTVTIENNDNKDGGPRRSIIRDRIHAVGGGGGGGGGKKKQARQYTWLNHEAAQKAAAELVETGERQLGKTTGTSSSHLLPPTAKYSKGDVIQVLYENKWWEATITKRQKRGDGFVYSVYYHGEEATQDEVLEEDLRPAEDASELAVELGFPQDWKASRKGARYVLTAPTGERFTSKKAALNFLKELQGTLVNSKLDVEDPPWRTEGHELIGRQFMWTFDHRASASRCVKIEQKGTVLAYIDAKDKDRNGSPGFISEKTGEPAHLFRITFADDPSHPYAKFLLDVQDMEEYEIMDCGLLPQEEEPPAATAVASILESPSGKSGAKKGKKRKK